MCIRDSCNTIGCSVGTHGEVASEPYQLVVDEDDDDAGAHVHQERRNADGKDIIHEFPLQFVDAFLEVEQLALVAEELELPHQRHQLRKDGGDGLSLIHIYWILKGPEMLSSLAMAREIFLI